jgi:hypothetical protein
MEPWYRATTPRREVREGRSFNPDEFAIALEQVVAGTAPADYLNPEQFFARTYFTAAMREQIGTVLRRLAGETEGAPPVLSFITQFGGGKTHTLTALWHLAGIGERAATLPGVADLLARERLPSVPKARLAVFVGNAWDPHAGRPTPWHDLAFQLGGEAAVATLGDAAPATPPGTAALARLFSAAGAPVLVLMDEVLNFMNRHRALADAFYAFLDNLIRAATGTRHVAVVLSLPKSAVEMTAYEQDWQDRITKAVKRVARDLITNDEAEVSEVVRRRLFEDLGSERNRTEVAKTYADWCFERRAQLPPQWTSVDPALTERRARQVLQDRFAACYPFHPATLSVFPRKWQSLPQYQQTRGTLGMLAQWLSRLYASHHEQKKPDPLITLGSAPLDDRSFRTTVLGQLGEPRLATAIDADIAADISHARALDADTKGPLKDIHRRVGAAMLFECAGGQTDKAAHLPELRFALGAPALDTTSVDNAAAALEGRAFFIRQVGSDGYRIGPRAKLNKVVAEKRASLDEARDVLPETRRLIRQVFEAGSPVPVIAFPPDGAAVRDTPRLSLLLADPTLEWDGSAELRDLLAEWTYRRGTEDRLFPASLIWCLRRPGHALADRVETALAWRAVRQDLAAALLGDDTDPDDVRSIDASIRAAETDAKEAVWGGYTFLAFADRQAAARLRVLDLGAGHSSSRETLAGRAIAALKTEGLLNDTVGFGYIDRKWPIALVAAGAWPLSGLRQSFLDGSLTRLFDPDGVLRSRIVEWVGSGQFGFASGALPGGGYQRVWFKELLPPEEVTFTADVYLLKSALAEALKNSPDRPATRPMPAATNPRPVTISIRGSVPAEQWNRLGTRQLVAELERILKELGLADQLKIERE